MEHSARVLVMAVQVLAGMWKRNGYSVFRQVITYQYSYPREMMYDKDIVMLQVSCGYYYMNCTCTHVHMYMLECRVSWVRVPPEADHFS